MFFKQNAFIGIFRINKNPTSIDHHHDDILLNHIILNHILLNRIFLFSFIALNLDGTIFFIIFIITHEMGLSIGVDFVIDVRF